MENNMFQKNTKLENTVFFIDNNVSNKNNIKRAIFKTRLKTNIKYADSISELVEVFKDKEANLPKCVFLNANRTNKDLSETQKLSQQLQKYCIPLVLFNDLEEKNKIRLNPKFTSSIIDGPFDTKKIIEMLYSIRIYWDNWYYSLSA